jgi:hypothetical protein
MKIQVLADEVNTLIEGIDRLLVKRKPLTNVARTLQWISFINTEIAYDPSLLRPFGALKAVMGSRLSAIEFFESHKNDSTEDWISVFDRWNVITSRETIRYGDRLELAHRSPNCYDYWRLVFLLESTQQGFIQQTLGVQALSEFTLRLSTIAKGLRLGLNIIKGKPKTDERWYPLFREVDDLITKMKKSWTGRQIIDSRLRPDWAEVKKYSEFAKNRHAGMVQSGYWKTYRQLRNFRLLAESIE